jgi:hypothetical protein
MFYIYLVEFCAQVAAGMSYLEKQKVIHADLAASIYLLISLFHSFIYLFTYLFIYLFVLFYFIQEMFY